MKTARLTKKNSISRFISVIILLFILLGAGISTTYAQEGDCPPNTTWDGVKCAPNDEGGNENGGNNNNNCPPGFRFDPGENGCVEINPATWTPTATITQTATPTYTPTATVTNTPTRTQTPTNTPIPTPTRSYEQLQTAMCSVKKNTNRENSFKDPIYIYSVKDKNAQQEILDRLNTLYGSSTCSADNYACQKLACELECDPVKRDSCVLRMSAFTDCGPSDSPLYKACHSEFVRKAKIRECDNYYFSPRLCKQFTGITNAVAYVAVALVTVTLVVGAFQRITGKKLFRRKKK